MKMNDISLSLIATLFLLGIASCSPKPEKLAAEIEALRQKLASATTFPLDSVAGNQLIDKSIQYADAFPKDTVAPRLLFQAAEVAKAIGKPQKSVELWERIDSQFSTFGKAPESLFLIAFTLENDLGNKDKAKEVYQSFIEKYPNHDLTDDAQQLLQFLQSGKTIDEIMKEFEQKSASQEGSKVVQ